jgi:hypothetical protein
MHRADNPDEVGHNKGQRALRSIRARIEKSRTDPRPDVPFDDASRRIEAMISDAKA